MRWSVVVVLWLASLCATTQFALSQENWLQADFRRESERVSDACGTFSVKAVPGCAIDSSPTIHCTLRREACRRRTALVWVPHSSPPRTPRIGGSVGMWMRSAPSAEPGGPAGT